MGEINVIKSMKMGCPSCIMLVKVGSFYDAYSKDAYIMSYLLGYKISEKQNIPMCGFPISSISKVENVLEKNKINYILLDKKANYEEEYRYINNQENNYEQIYNKAKREVGLMFRIQKINNLLVQSIGDPDINIKIEKIEKVLQND